MHSAGRIVRKAALLLFIVSLTFNSTFADNEKSQISVKVLQPLKAELKPLETKTWTFRIKNNSKKSLDLETEAVLPSGWTAITPPGHLSLAPEKSSVHLLAIFVPINAEAGEYRLLFRVKSRQSALIYQEVELAVNVPLVTDIKIESVERPSMVVAGDSYEILYRLSNFGNSAVILTLDCQSDNNIPVFIKESEIQLQSGQSIPVTLYVETPPDIRWKIRHRIRLTAVDQNYLGNQGTDSDICFVDIIPSISGENRAHHLLPMEISLVGMQGATKILQAGISGSGTLRDTGTSRIEFMVRGPRREDLQQFGYTHESLNLKFSSKFGEISFSDKVFSLTKMTEYGMYGRGFEGRINLKKLSLTAYLQRGYFQSQDIDQRAFQILYSPKSESLSLAFNYLENGAESEAKDQIMSLSTRLSLSSLFRSHLEIASGFHRRGGQKTVSGQGFWMEAMGKWDRSGYRLSIIESSRSYPGRYQNLSFRSSSISWGMFKNFALKASYHEMKRRPNENPLFQGVKEKSYQISLNYLLSQKLNFSAAYRARSRRLPLISGTVDYIDRMLRLGLSPRLNFLNLNAELDIGDTHNRITGEHQRLLEFNVSGTGTFFKRLSLTGNFQSRNQKDNFTGDFERGNNISLNAGLCLKSTKISAYYRSSLYREFYDRIIYDRDLVQEMLFSQLTFFEFSIQRILKNKHSLTFRIRRAADPNSRDSRGRLIGLIEYKIPIGIPVSRLSDRGSLAGRIVGPSTVGIPGVVVELNQLSTLTDREGRFFFYSVTPGEYLFKIKHGSFPEGMISLKNLPIKIYINEKEKSRLEIPVIQAASLNGYVFLYKDKSPGQKIIQKEDTGTRTLKKDRPTQGVVIEIRGDFGVFYRKTDKKGYFNFESIKPGLWEVTAYSNSLPELHVFENERISINLEAGQEKEVLFKVVPKKRQIRIIQTGTIGTGSSAGGEHISRADPDITRFDLIETLITGHQTSLILEEMLQAPVNPGNDELSKYQKNPDIGPLTLTKSYLAETLFFRPEKTSGDDQRSSLVIKHSNFEYQKGQPFNEGLIIYILGHNSALTPIPPFEPRRKEKILLEIFQDQMRWDRDQFT